jgi:hypothetical protein
LTAAGGVGAAVPVRRRGSRLALLLGTGVVLIVIAAGAWIAGLFGSTKPIPGEPGSGAQLAAPSNSPPALADPGVVAPLPMPASAVQRTDAASGSTALPLPSLPVQATIAVPGADARAASRAPAPRVVPNAALKRVPALPGQNAAVAEPPPQSPAPTAAPSAAVLASPQAAPTLAPAGPADPNSVCGKRILLAYHRCMLRECDKPEFAGHGECARVKAIEERQKNSANQ